MTPMPKLVVRRGDILSKRPWQLVLVARNGGYDIHATYATEAAAQRGAERFRRDWEEASEGDGVQHYTHQRRL